MATTDTKTTFTPEDLLTMPDGNRYELVDGQLVEKQRSLWSSYVAGEAHGRLARYADDRQAGWVLQEGTTYQCFPDAPLKVRKPDTSFIRLIRLSAEEAMQEGQVRIAPDLAVEVVSPTDSYYEVENKVVEFLDAGVKVVWVVNPNNRTARIHRADRIAITIGENEDLTAEEILPGFRCRLGDLFQPPKSDA